MSPFYLVLQHQRIGTVLLHNTLATESQALPTSLSPWDANGGGDVTVSTSVWEHHTRPFR